MRDGFAVSVARRGGGRFAPYSLWRSRRRQTPLLFLTVLLHSLQFERALAFLYSYPEFCDEALHLALALDHAGLLRAAYEPSMADGSMLDAAVPGRPTLCLFNMLEREVRQ